MKTNTTYANLTKILQRPIPLQTVAHDRKAGYRRYSLLTNHSRNKEPLVDIAGYGIAGQSYYSRPNNAAGALTEVRPAVYVRQDIARRLADINHALAVSETVTKLFGGRVELYVQEGLRSRSTQALLYNEVFPRLIRDQQPHMTEQEVLARRDQLIAAPQPADSPSPHATGAAVDVTLRYADSDLGYKPKQIVDMGHARISDHTASPDFYEQTDKKLSAAEKTARQHRRAFYWIMRGALSPAGDSGLVCNPTEWWHWSYGDQMWAALTEAPFAFYGAAEQEPSPEVPGKSA